MKKLNLIAIFAALVALVAVSPVFALSVPEKLVYDVSWTGIKAGTAVQEVTVKGGDVHIVSTTHSASWINPFFPVDDRTESVLARGAGSEHIGTPKWFKEKINEGRFHSLKEAHFDPQRLTVDTKDLRSNTSKTDPISTRTYDTLSAIYAVRTLDLVPGTSVYIDIYDCKHLWNTEVQVVKREEISTPVGRFKTLVVKPHLRSEGLFARTGDVTVWITDDSLRIPVKMTTKVKLGKITATLVGGSYWPEKDE
jgi:hypothetical protein